FVVIASIAGWESRARRYWVGRNMQFVRLNLAAIAAAVLCLGGLPLAAQGPGNPTQIFAIGVGGHMVTGEGGLLYVADLKRNRIASIYPNGQINTFYPFGQINRVMTGAIAFDRARTLLVPTTDGAVQRISRLGELMGVFIAASPGREEARAIVVGRDGDVWVANGGFIERFSPEG